MDMMKTGQFIAALRRSSGLSQKEVAERLGVGDKAISKWECGRGLPDIATLPALAELFGVTVDELLRGDRLLEEKQSDAGRTKSAAQANAYMENQGRQIYNLLYMTLGCLAAGAILLFILLETTFEGPLSCGVSLLFCAACGILLSKSWREAKHLERYGAQVQVVGARLAEKMREILSFFQKILFGVLFLSILSASLLITAMQSGGMVAAIDRGSILHYWVAVMGAGAGVLLFRHITQEKQLKL